MIFLHIILLIFKVSSFGSSCSLARNLLSNELPALKSTFFKGKGKHQKQVKIAILSDQGLGANSRNVLKMVSDWSPELLLIPGDFDYQDSPQSFIHQITDVMGKDFPVIAAPGNHDILMWFGFDGYRDVLLKQTARSGLKHHCFGDYGINSACLLGDILIIQSGVGTLGTEHAQYIDKVFSRYFDTPWKICIWHKNQKLLQTGDKQDETGYLVYETCRKHGAMIFTGHEHSYERTHLMSNFETQQIASNSSQLDLSPGKSFAAVVGLGGDSIRPWRFGLEKNPWWAAKASLNNNVNYGALMCTLGLADSDVYNGKCFFKDISGVVWDNFTITSPKIKEKYFCEQSQICNEQIDLDQLKEVPMLKASTKIHGKSLQNTSLLNLGREYNHHLQFSLSITDIIKAKEIFLQTMLVTSSKSSQTGSIRISVKRGNQNQQNLISNLFSYQVGILSLVFNSRTFLLSSFSAEHGEVWLSPNLKPILLPLTKNIAHNNLQVSIEIQGTFPIDSTFIHGITSSLQSCAAPVLLII